MTRYQLHILFGIFVALTGGIITFLSHNPSEVMRYLIPFGLLVSAAFILSASFKNQTSQTLVKYFRLQGAGIIAFAFALLLYANGYEQFIFVNMAFLLYFGIAEILYGFQVMAYKQKPRISFVTFRMMTGLVVAVGAVAILATAFVDRDLVLLLTGILLVLSGLNFMIFAKLIHKLAIRTASRATEMTFNKLPV